MSRHYLLVLFLSLTISALAFSQADTTSRNWVQAGYFGQNITHYGLSVGYGYSLYQKTIVNNKKGK